MLRVGRGKVAGAGQLDCKEGFEEVIQKACIIFLSRLILLY